MIKKFKSSKTTPEGLLSSNFSSFEGTDGKWFNGKLLP
jgi:hypothetical protein